MASSGTRGDEAAIERARAEIGGIDDALLRLLGERRRLSRQIGTAKRRLDLPVRDLRRERELRALRVECGKRLGLDEQLVARLFREILEDSIVLQESEVQSGLREPPAVPREDPAPCPDPARPIDGARRASLRLVDRGARDEGTIVEVGRATFGGSRFTVVAGPCSVESEEQVLACAVEVAAAGGAMLRGGCFKARSSPYSFQGLGWRGLDCLVEAGRRVDLPIVTEVVSPEQVAPIAERADMLQVGSRNMQNFELLKAVGRVDCPVLLKRGMMATLDELLNAAEYVYAEGNERIVLCERGIRTFEPSTRNTLDLSAVPVLRSRTHLPVIVDPSHAAGKREWVPALARAAWAVGAHGVMIEIHPDPAAAQCDGPQALGFPAFRALMEQLVSRHDRESAGRGRV
jgi:3-deoxy-7-phosphoheptulonate synthase